MPEFHSEPYIYLPAVSHKSALIAWGAFYFRTNSQGKWKIVDDDDLKYVHPPRKDSIGAQSAPYGPGARRGLRRVRRKSVSCADDRSRESLLGRRPAARHRIHLQSVRERAGVGERRAVGLVGEGTGARAVGRELRQPLSHQPRSGARRPRASPSR